jgi:hypothetical protein
MAVHTALMPQQMQEVTPEMMVDSPRMQQELGMEHRC